MAGPWDLYQSQQAAPAGPWTLFGPSAASSTAAPPMPNVGGGFDLSNNGRPTPSAYTPYYGGPETANIGRRLSPFPDASVRTVQTTAEPGVNVQSGQASTPFDQPAGNGTQVETSRIQASNPNLTPEQQTRIDTARSADPGQLRPGSSSSALGWHMDEFGRWVRDAAISAVQGLTANFGDELVGLVSPGAARTMNADTAMFREQNPTASVVANGAGNAALSYLTGGFGPGIVKNVAVNAGIGAASGAGAENGGTVAERARAAIPGAVVGGVAGLLGRTATVPGLDRVSAVLRDRLVRAGVQDADILAANQLIKSAQTQGVTLTWPEALNSVTNGRIDMRGLQSLVERNEGSQPVMTEAMSQRPGQVAAAGADALDTLGPVMDPATTGVRSQAAATSTVRDTQRAINDVTRPLYNQAAQTIVPQADFVRLMADPVFAEAYRIVRSTPGYNRDIAGLAPNSVGVLQRIGQVLDDRALAETSPTGTVSSLSRNYTQAAGDVRTAAETASPEFATAQQQQSIMRGNVLEPEEAGPTGQIARSGDVGQQQEALFPASPQPGSQAQVARTVRDLAAQDPEAAGSLVRGYVENAFNEATQRLPNGPNQFGGADFAAMVTGNTQQAKNLEAAVTALHGPDTWRGFQSFLDVLQATGARQRTSPGSTALAGSLSKGNLIAQTATTLLSPARLANAIGDFADKIRLGRNAATLANVILDPSSVRLLRELANATNPVIRERIAAQIILQSSGVQGSNAAQPSEVDLRYPSLPQNSAPSTTLAGRQMLIPSPAAPSGRDALAAALLRQQPAQPAWWQNGR